MKPLRFRMMLVGVDGHGVQSETLVLDESSLRDQARVVYCALIQQAIADGYVAATTSDELRDAQT